MTKPEKMPRQIPLFILAIALLFAAAHTLADNADDAIHKFTYSGSNGPANWGSLDPSFSLCSSGEKQSPINIIKKDAEKNKDMKALDRNYKPANATLINYGFDVALLYDTDCGGLKLDGEFYELKQMHWHAPSEHQINGKQFPLELHEVHKSSSGKISVVSVLYKYGKADSCLAKLKNKLDKLAEESCEDYEHAYIPLGVLNNKFLTKRINKYYRYVGSLTTPPCTEGVIWNVVYNIRTVSKEQVEALRAMLNDDCQKNSRPLQSLNGRKVEKCDEN